MKEEETTRRAQAGHGATAWLDALARNIPTFLLAMHHFVERGHADRVLWYWQWISGYLWAYGRYPEYVQCDEYALAAAEQVAQHRPSEGRRLIAIICAELAYACMEIGEWDAADVYGARAEVLFRELRDSGELMKVSRYRAQLKLRQGDLQGAEQLCMTALDHLDVGRHDGTVAHSETLQYTVTHELDAVLQPPPVAQIDRALAGPVHCLLGTIYYQQGDHARARRELVLALWLARLMPGQARAYWSLGPLLSLGQLYAGQGRTARARACYQRCIAQTKEGVEPALRAGACVGLARLLATADGAAARELLREAVTIYEAQGRHGDKSDALRLLRMLESGSAGCATDEATRAGHGA